MFAIRMYGTGARAYNLRTSDGATLTISTKITSPKLPVPVEYKMTYKRK